MTKPTADDYFASVSFWAEEVRQLRALVVDCGLTETVKWNRPCYTLQGKNVVGINAFKSYFGLWFFQGVLLEDPARVLLNAQEGKTRALRQWRMTSAKDIKPRAVRRYIQEAMRLVRDGKTIKPERNKPLEVPAALAQALRSDQKAAAGFRELRPGQQREYIDYLASAKRADTVTRRLARILPLLAAGAGLNDRYRK